jgi:hypothetical protein
VILGSSCGPGQRSPYSDWPRAERSGDLIPVGGQDFPHPSRPTLELSEPPVQWVAVFFPPWGKPAWVWRWIAATAPPPQSSAEFRQRVELYFSLGPSLPLLRWTSPLFYLEVFALLGSYATLIVTDVSGQPIGHHPQYGAEMLLRNICN